MSDLFTNGSPKSGYDASEIEVLEGLEPSGIARACILAALDERALHHLAAEILDNSMDEAVAGHANWIEIVVEDHQHP